MNLITVGRVDKSIFEEGSAEQTRIAGYGELFDRLVVVAFFPKKAGYVATKIAPNVEIVPTNSVFSFLYPWSAYRIVGALLKGADWVISTQDPFDAGIVGYMIRKKYNTPLHVQVHTDVMSPYFRMESLKNKIRYLLACFILQRADGIRVVSKRIFQSLVTAFQELEKKIIVSPIYVPIDSSFASAGESGFRHEWQHFDFLFLMASRLTREKDFPMAITTMKRVVEQRPHVGLLIVGDGPEKKKLQRLVDAANLHEHIIFVPRTEHILPYYKMCDLLLITSRYEGYGRTAIEALSVGKPVVMTDVGVAGWIVQDHDNGLIVPVGDDVACAKALVSFIDDRVLRHRLQESARDPIPYSMTEERYKELYKASIEGLIKKQ
jgi:glycosyltransferase involved in cell wall biosynthesis